jgi:hypothetical protein
MNEQARQAAFRHVKEKIGSILALWQAVPPRTCVNGIRLPNELRELAAVQDWLLDVVAQQQEVLEAQEKEIRQLKERLGS